jgi:small subunit ribosomal protein S8
MDPIANLLTSIRNGYLARKSTIVIPHSKNIASICDILVKHQFIKTFTIKELDKIKKNIEIELEYLPGQKPVLSGIKRLSRPSVRLYASKNKLPRPVSKVTLSIISTSQGIMSDKDARAKGLGGELICQVW